MPERMIPVPESLVEKAAAQLEAAGSIFAPRDLRALLSQPTQTAERSEQAPGSDLWALRTGPNTIAVRRGYRVVLSLTGDDEAGAVARSILRLIPAAEPPHIEDMAPGEQPTPIAEPECICNTGPDTDGPDIECPAHGLPPRVEDMTPGTTFGDGHHRYTVEPILLREVRRDDGQKFYADEIDPSTIRDVTPPKETI